MKMGIKAFFDSLSTKSRLFLGLPIILYFFIMGSVMKEYLAIRFLPNVKKDTVLFIKGTEDLQELTELLKKRFMLIDPNYFYSLAQKMGLNKKNIKKGRYVIEKGIDNWTIIKKLKWGLQDPIKLTINNIKTRNELVEYCASHLAFAPNELLMVLDDENWLKGLDKHLTKDNSWSVFVENTYEFYWNIEPKKLFQKMYKHYKEFMNKRWTRKINKTNFSSFDVIILASIVDAETLIDTEMETIAGLYINRLKKNMKLQADPTVFWALQHFDLKRMLNKYLSIKNPYNTYRYYGLPPGPIMLPSIKAIDAVLNYAQHDYLYMCAKSDFSGFHTFTNDGKEHQKNAYLYSQALNKLEHEAQQ